MAVFELLCLVFVLPAYTSPVETTLVSRSSEFITDSQTFIKVLHENSSSVTMTLVTDSNGLASNSLIKTNAHPAESLETSIDAQYHIFLVQSSKFVSNAITDSYITNETQFIATSEKVRPTAELSANLLMSNMTTLPQKSRGISTAMSENHTLLGSTVMPFTQDTTSISILNGLNQSTDVFVKPTPTPYLVTPSLPVYNTPARRPLKTTSTNKPYTLSCGLTQLHPVLLNITEEDKDKDLMKIQHSNAVNISVDFILPENSLFIFKKHFKILTVDSYTTVLHLGKPVDIEEIYLKTGIVFTSIVLKIGCPGSKLTSWTMVNISVEDVDDSGPVFQQSDSSKCALPLYSAGTAEQFIGILHLSPGSIHATDGDLVKSHMIYYSFLHGDPVNYQNFFVINNITGSVNKTKNITDADPHDFVILVQATEDSSTKRSRVAVLEVSVSPPIFPATNNVYRANKTVITILQILSVIVILGFTLGFLFIVRHRRKKQKIGDEKTSSKEIDDIEEFMLSTSTIEVETCIHPVLKLPDPEPTMLSVPSPDPARTSSQSPVSPKRVKFVLPEKTYRMIYGTKGKRLKKS